MKLRSVTVSVPASTSNLGSGFDTLGLAVKLYNSVTVRIASKQHRNTIITLDPEQTQTRSILEPAAEAFFKFADVAPVAVDVSCKNEIPVARGLGFSSTVRVGLIAALDALCATRLTRSEVLQLATQLEGHPDNASPAVWGGFTVSARIAGSVHCWRFDVLPKVRLVTAIPAYGIETEKARSLLPSSFSKEDTAHALNRAAVITGAFASQNYDSLGGAFDDRFHQPYREKLLPGLRTVIEAGETAGAIGGWLSGSGSAIMCLTTRDPKQVASAMRTAMPEAEIRILKPENSGYQIRRG